MKALSQKSWAPFRVTGLEYNVLTFFEAFCSVAPVKHEWQLPHKNESYVG